MLAFSVAMVGMVASCSSSGTAASRPDPGTTTSVSATQPATSSAASDSATPGGTATSESQTSSPASTSAASSHTAPSRAASTTATTATTATSAAPAKTYAVGKTTTYASWLVTIQSVQFPYPTKSTTYKPWAGQAYLRVSIQVKNVSTKTDNFSHMELSITDSSGMKYVSDGPGAQGLHLPDCQLAPGASCAGDVVFMVPANAHGLDAVVSEFAVGPAPGVVPLPI
ncbi:hypothetical protein ABH935_004937 [Catenulispora sp. GAS73]|uniref:DUF4352 domain-containing protein n=1 Tax=Catenulispora sp. GAS73 TaxID=3156269 RepID=UPI0035139CB0